MGNKSTRRCEHNDGFFDSIAEAKIKPFVAIVGGGTGATGKRLVKRLCEHPNCAEVILLTRRRVLLKNWFQVNDLDAHKISQYVIDFTKPLDLVIFCFFFFICLFRSNMVCHDPISHFLAFPMTRNWHIHLRKHVMIMV